MGTIGISTSGLERLQALAHCNALYPKYSWKRRLAFFWNLLVLLIRPNGRDVSLPEDVFLQHLHQVASSTGMRSITTLNHKFWEKSRLYSLACNRSSRATAFVKASFAEQEHPLLQKEADILQKLEGGKGKLRMPQLISVTTVGRQICIAQTCVPEGYIILDKTTASWPKELFQSLRAYTSIEGEGYSSVRMLSWWPGLEEHTDASFVAHVEHQCGGHTLPVGFAHGDMGSENVFCGGENNFFLIDWECWAPDAPRYADELGFWLGKHNKQIRRHRNNQETLSSLFNRSFIAGLKVPEEEATFALAFMVSRNFDLAGHIARAVAYKAGKESV